MSSTTKRPSMEPRKEARAPAQPWGQKILRDRAVELLRSGAVAPSAVLANLLAASANPVLDETGLSAQPRPLGAEASRLVSAAMAKLRLPNADQGAILDGLMKLAWVAKTSSAREAKLPASKGPRPASKPAAKTGGKLSKNVAPKKPALKAAAKPAAPVIVRKSARVAKEG